MRPFASKRARNCEPRQVVAHVGNDAAGDEHAALRAEAERKISGDVAEHRAESVERGAARRRSSPPIAACVISAALRSGAVSAVDRGDGAIEIFQAVPGQHPFGGDVPEPLPQQSR